jgi:guanylate kinase
LSEETFDQKMKEDAFYEVSFYHQYRYGIQKKDVLKGGVVIVEPNGANTLIKKAPKEVFIVYVDTSEAMREKRMIERGDQPLIVKSRLENDRLVFNKTLISRIDLILENEDHTLDELANMVHQAYQAMHQKS